MTETKYDTKDKLLVKGDFSGIQEFIFNTKTKGAAKTLKGKSFYIQILAELAIKHIEKKVGKNEVMCIYNGGGNFFLFVPNTVEVKSELSKCELTFAEELRNKGLMLILTTIEYQQGLNFGQNLSQLNQKALEKSLNRFSNLESSWEALFQAEVVNTNFDDEGKRVTESVIRKDSKPVVTYFGESFCLSESQTLSQSVNLQIPKWNTYQKSYFSELKQENPNLEIEIGEYGEVLSFEHLGLLAKQRTGTDNLGILKLDLDNLGTIIRDDIKNIEQNQEFSALLTKFFDEKLKDLITKKTFTVRENTYYYKDNLYVIFAGGDDAYLIGAWDAVVYFTQLFYKEFNAFFKENKPRFVTQNLTFSAGLVFVSSSFPVTIFSELAEEALAKAKTFKDSKNALTIFDYTIDWTQLEAIFEQMESFIKAIDTQGLPKSFLSKVKKTHSLYDNRFELTAITRLMYDLKADKLKSVHKDLINSLKDSYKTYLQNALQDESKKNEILILPIAARLAEFSTRKTKKKDE